MITKKGGGGHSPTKIQILKMEMLEDETAPFNWESLKNKKVLIGLSGGINSMAVLCQFIESGVQPSELHLFYAHFKEHSPDTFRFVKDGIRYAKEHFESVKVKITRNSVLSYFEQQNMIPHPARSPCSMWLKIEPINRYSFENQIKIDLVGYIKKELKRRGGKQQKVKQTTLFSLDKLYPIGNYDDEWCFEIVLKHLEWYPNIYNLRFTEQDFTEGLCEKKQIGQRVFKHNNCLPCKNCEVVDLLNVKKHFPEYHKNAMETSNKIDRFWGRDSDAFYSQFGRDLGQEITCESCKW